MPKLPVLSGIQVVKVLSRLNFSIDHQTGSHIIMRREGKPVRTVTIPRHKELKPGTLRSIIKQAGLTVEDFVGML